MAYLSLENVIKQVVKYPTTEKFVVGIDFASRLPTGVTLSASGHTITAVEVDDDTNDVTGTVLGTATVSGSILSIPLLAGVAGQRYRVDIKASTSSSDIAPEERFLLEVKG